MNAWKMKDGRVLHGYDELGNKRKEPYTIPWGLLVVIGIVLSLVGRWAL